MILVVDIGNSNIVLGLFDACKKPIEDAKYVWRLHTNALRTADEYTSIVRSLFRESNIQPEDISFCFMSSVVPSLNAAFKQTLFTVSGKEPAVFNAALYDDLPVGIVEQARNQIGTDLLANAVGGFLYYGTECIIVDFGTALTFTIVDASGMVQGVAIAPGLKTAVSALFKNTAQLPSVALQAPQSVLGTDTVSAIQSGIVLGYSELVSGMLRRIREIQGFEHAPAIATGGLAHSIENGDTIFTHIDTQFTLKALACIANHLIEKSVTSD